MNVVRALGLCALFVPLVACGGGGASGGGDPPPVASATQVLVDAESRSELDELCAETGATVLDQVEGTTYYVVGLPEGASKDDFLKELDGDVRVVDAEEDAGAQFPEGGGSTIPLFGDDPLESVGSQPALTRIGAPAAHGRATGAGVLVAVIDTGVVATHPLLAGRVAAGGWDFVDGDPDPTDAKNGLDDDGDGLVDEGFGHGTFVASLVLAVAPGARILPVRALNSDAVGTASTVAHAIAWAVSQGADVVNLSIGIPADLRMIQQAVQSAREAGVPVFAAAGNLGGAVEYPAALSDATAIAATDLLDRKAPFSSYGSAVDLSAPGVNLIGAHPDGPAGTARWSGTSFATALATGGYALLVERRPDLAAQDRAGRLLDTSVPIDGLNPAYSGRLGKGRVDVDAATR